MYMYMRKDKRIKEDKGERNEDKGINKMNK